MRKHYLLKALTLLVTAVVPALSFGGTRVTYTFDVQRTLDNADEPTVCDVNTSAIQSKFKQKSDAAIMTSLSDKSLKLYAVQASSGKFYATYTCSEGYGHWFTKKGYATKASSGYVQVQYDTDAFNITHKAGKPALGDTVTVREAFASSSDTIEYVFNVVFSNKNEVKTDQPSGFLGGRKSSKDNWIAIPVMSDGVNTYTNQNYIQVNAGDKITLNVLPKDSGDVVRFQVYNRLGKSIRSLKKGEFTLTESADSTHSGFYKVTTRVNTANNKINARSFYVYVDVQTEPEGTLYDWTAHTPHFSYDFHDEYGEIPMPTKILNDCGSTVAGRYSDRWWTVQWGKNRNPLIKGDTDDEDPGNMYKNMLEKYNDDFQYIRDNMGWPPDKRARRGYKSTICVYGSGLSSDNADNTATGGWQSATYYNGESWPMVLASYYPISRFADDADSKYSDGDYQREAMIHEGIHAIFADMEGVKNSAWFHEAGNTWLQSAMTTERYGKYGTPGFLDACPFIAPFMPIECYSGWLQDGSFGGPSAEGVNMYSGSQQICTWRNLLGGNQYGNGFPIILGEMCGKGSIPWIWRYCKSRVLEGIGDSIGEQPMRSLIQQYRSRQATFDIGGWAEGYRYITDTDMGVTVKPEWEPYWIDCGEYKLTPYATLYKNDNDGWLAPDTLTNPGWSGSNIIPIHVEGDRCKVEFLPEDTEMRAQLCYRTKDGKIYYSQPVHCGTMTMDLTDKPANGVIFCVVANTDYIYTGDAQRKKHFDYRIRLGENALATADAYKRWYFYEQDIKDTEFETGIKAVNEDITAANDNGVKLGSGAFHAGDNLNIDLNGIDASDVRVRIVGVPGLVAADASLNAQGTYTLPENLPHGMYIVTFSHGDKKDVYKVFIK